MRKILGIATEFDDRLIGGDAADLIEALAGNDRLRGKGGDDTLDGGAGNDDIRGNAGADVLRGGAGIDTITGGGGADVFLFGTEALLQAPDQLTDWNVAQDVFGLDADAFGVTGALSFQNALAADLVENGANVIVLQTTDDDANAATSFNARSAARLIGAEVETDGAGFFIYHNSALGVNRLVFSANLDDGEAALTVLGAVLTTTGADAIAELASYSAGNFDFV